MTCIRVHLCIADTTQLLATNSKKCRIGRYAMPQFEGASIDDFVRQISNLTLRECIARSRIVVAHPSCDVSTARVSSRKVKSAQKLLVGWKTTSVRQLDRPARRSTEQLQQICQSSLLSSCQCDCHRTCNCCCHGRRDSFNNDGVLDEDGFRRC